MPAASVASECGSPSAMSEGTGYGEGMPATPGLNKAFCMGTPARVEQVRRG